MHKWQKKNNKKDKTKFHNSLNAAKMRAIKRMHLHTYIHTQAHMYASSFAPLEVKSKLLLLFSTLHLHLWVALYNTIYTRT